jgi:hypothetical protein
MKMFESLKTQLKQSNLTYRLGNSKTWIEDM